MPVEKDKSNRDLVKMVWWSYKIHITISSPVSMPMDPPPPHDNGSLAT